MDVHLTRSELATMCEAAEITLQKVLRKLRIAVVGRHRLPAVNVRDAAALNICADLT